MKALRFSSGSNDLLIYLAGLTPAPGDSLELAAEENHPDAQVRDATLHKHHKNAEQPRATKQIARTSVVAAGQ